MRFLLRDGRAVTADYLEPVHRGLDSSHFQGMDSSHHQAMGSSQLMGMDSSQLQGLDAAHPQGIPVPCGSFLLDSRPSQPTSKNPRSMVPTPP